MKFSPKAFISPFEYLDTEETAAKLQTYKMIINSGAPNNVFAVSVIFNFSTLVVYSSSIIFTLDSY